MTILRLATKASERQGVRIAFAFTTSALTITVLLAVASVSAQDPLHPRWGLVALFVLCALLFIASFRYATNALTLSIESVLYQLRLRLCEKVRRAELYRLEQLGLTEIYDRVMRQTMVISNSAWSLALGIHSAVSIACTILYVAFLSPRILAVMAALCLVAGPAFVRRRRQSASLTSAAGRLQTALFDGLTDLLEGHNEVVFRAQRGTELVDEFGTLADKLRVRTMQIHSLDQGNYVFVNLAIFLVLSVHVFILPQYVSTNLAALSPITSTILFLLNPITNLLNSWPDFERANFAARQLEELEQQFDATAASQPAAADPWKGHFTTLHAQGLYFQYAGGAVEKGFHVGPASFSIQAGEIIFFVGGNGSGKTTLLKLLSALYLPSAGRLLVDDVPVTASNAQAYREMIAAIFTDFHLFKKLYGISGLAEKEVARALREMRIADRTSFSGGRFSNLDLSTGQRKRLAMVVALLEDRPLYIFDEWAADQDPEFRRYYYEWLLPSLKSQGKTVLAISHDDRYFHCADRVITMDAGTIESISSS